MGVGAGGLNMREIFWGVVPRIPQSSYILFFLNVMCSYLLNEMKYFFSSDAKKTRKRNFDETEILALLECYRQYPHLYGETSKFSGECTKQSKNEV